MQVKMNMSKKIETLIFLGVCSLAIAGAFWFFTHGIVLSGVVGLISFGASLLAWRDLVKNLKVENKK